MNLQTSIYGREGWNTNGPANQMQDPDLYIDPLTKAARPSPTTNWRPSEEEVEFETGDQVSFGQCHLDLVIMGATGLNQVYGDWISDKFLIPGRSDPYVVCRSSDGMVLTVTKPLDSRSNSTDSAVWNHYAGIPYTRNQTLLFEIHDTETDMEFGAHDDVIAQAILEHKSMAPGVHDLPLSDKDGNKGMLRVGVIATPTRPLHDQELVLMIATGKRIPNVHGELFGGLKSCPYVVCTVPGKEDKLTFRTPTIKQELSPTWNFPSVLRFKNFDGCDSLMFEIFHDTEGRGDHRLLAIGLIAPQEIAVGVHKIVLCDPSSGQPFAERSELKLRIFSVPKFLRIVSRAQEKKDLLASQLDVTTSLAQVEQAEQVAELTGHTWEDMNPQQQVAFLQQKEAAKVERRRVKDERRRLRAIEEVRAETQATAMAMPMATTAAMPMATAYEPNSQYEAMAMPPATAQAPGGQDEMARLREEVAILRAEKELSKQQELLVEAQRQQLLLNEAKMKHLQEAQMMPSPGMMQKPMMHSSGMMGVPTYEGLSTQATYPTAPMRGPAGHLQHGFPPQGYPQQGYGYQPLKADGGPFQVPSAGLEQSLGEMNNMISSIGLGR